MRIGAGMKRIKSAASKLVFDIALRMADFSINNYVIGNKREWLDNEKRVSHKKCKIDF